MLELFKRKEEEEQEYLNWLVDEMFCDGIVMNVKWTGNCYEIFRKQYTL